MIDSAYQTTAASAAAAATKPIQMALKQAFIHGDLAPAKSLKGEIIEGVYIVPPYLKGVAPFTMPLEFETAHGEAIAVDARGFMRGNDADSLKVVQPGEYEGAVLQAALTRIWRRNGATEMRRWNDLAAKVYIRLVSETLVRVLHLSAYDQQPLAVLTGYFYYTLFIGNQEILRNEAITHEEREKIIVAVSRITRVNPSKVEEIIREDLTRPYTLQDFAEMLKREIPTPRLEKLSDALIMQMLGGIWYGGNARQLVAVALEFPPAWLTMIFQAVNDRGFRGAGLTKMVEDNNKQDAGARFTRDVLNALEDFG
jgi:hypothetical protein